MSSFRFISAKLRQPNIRERIFRERFAEPLHMNAIAVLVALFGSFRSKVYFDLVVRPHHAYGLLAAADAAKAQGFSRFTAIECGVANGAGLLNMCRIGSQVTAATGIGIDFVGFDNASGMPLAVDYRDHPEYYQPGDFVMGNRSALVAALPANARLVIGDVKETIPAFIAGHDTASPLGFVSVDVDYYSSTVDCLALFVEAAEKYLMAVLVYLDDVQDLGHNRFAGEMLAVEEFNDANTLRKITPTNFLRERRLFKRAGWISQIYTLHVFDSANRARILQNKQKVVLSNPYID